MMRVPIVVVMVVLFFWLWWWRSSWPHIPKIIYTFWHEKELPPLIKKCIESWKRHCPDYEIRVLNYDNTTFYKHSADSHQRHSDFVRLDKLYETGGIWIDASVFLNQSLDWVYECGPPRDIVGYFIDDNQTKDDWPSIETWFLAAPKGSKLIRDWREEFMKYNEYETVNEYLSAEMKGIDYSRMTDPYLLVYVSQQKCIQKNYSSYDMKLFDVKDDAYLHLAMNGFNPEPAVKEFCEGVYANKTRMTKLRRVDRPFVEKSWLELNKIMT